MASSQHMDGSQTVGQVYAEAMLDLAQEADQLSDVADELTALGELLAEQPDLQRLLGSRVLSATERARSIEQVFKGRVSDLVYQFLQVVNLKGRLEALPGIIAAFRNLLDERQGVVEVDAYVASELSDSQTQVVSQRIGEVVNRNVVLRQTVDPKLIGGVKLRIGDQLIDGSVATQLKIMRNAMVAAGREKATTALDQVLEG